MHQPSAASLPYRLLLGIGLLATGAAPPGWAASIVIPPLTITQLEHWNNEDGRVSDHISIPGPGYTASTFAATIALGDVVSFRIQAPVGKKFVVHGPASFFFSVYWLADVPGFIAPAIEEPHTITFENLKGAVPSQTYSLVELGDERRIVQVWKYYTVAAAFEFTAIAVEITSVRPFQPIARNYSILGSYSTPSIGALGFPLEPEAPIMELVDIATPVHATSWGKLKALYR